MTAVNLLTLFCFVGVATRVCDKDNGWQKPSLLECASNSFLVLQGRVSIYISMNGCNSFDFIFMRARFYLLPSLLRRTRIQQQPHYELSLHLAIEKCQRFEPPNYNCFIKNPCSVVIGFYFLAKICHLATANQNTSSIFRHRSSVSNFFESKIIRVKWAGKLEWLKKDSGLRKEKSTLGATNEIIKELQDSQQHPIPRSNSRLAAAGLVPPLPLSVKYPLEDHPLINCRVFFFFSCKI